MTTSAPVAPRVVLVGPPGAGKTTVGALLATALGVGLRDTDSDVEQAEGRSVADIFVESGEERFRELERRAVASALTAHPGVLALGGGAVLDAATQEDLRRSVAGHGTLVVLLDVGLADAAARIGLNTSRPLLVGNPRAQWLRLMERRRAVYAAVSTHVVPTDGRTPQDVAAQVAALL